MRIDATGPAVLSRTLCAKMFTLSQVAGKASLSRMDVDTDNKWVSRRVRFALRSISKVCSRKLTTSSRRDANIITRNTTAVSPKAQLKYGGVSRVMVPGIRGVGGIEMFATSEKGYDAGNVTGIGVGVVPEVRTRSIAFIAATLWSSRYDSNILLNNENQSRKSTWTGKKKHKELTAEEGTVDTRHCSALVAKASDRQAWWD